MTLTVVNKEDNIITTFTKVDNMSIEEDNSNYILAINGRDVCKVSSKLHPKLLDAYSSLLFKLFSQTNEMLIIDREITQCSYSKDELI